MSSNGSNGSRISIAWDGIPADLKGRNLWIGWRGEPITGKDGIARTTKVPVMCRDLERKASTTDPATWCSYEICKLSVEMFPDSLHGPGICLQEGLLGVDFDHCRNPATGEIADWAWGCIQILASYAEISQSGTGVHVLLWAKLETLAHHLGVNVKDLSKRSGYQGGTVEVYDSSTSRYFTVSGVHLPGTPRTVEARQDEFDEFYKHVLGEDVSEARQRSTQRKKAVATAAINNPFHLEPDDEVILDLIRMASNAEKFQALWDGEWTTVSNASGRPYPSQSEADAALVAMLAFYTLDEQQLERLFRQSGLYRPEKDRDTYLGATVTAGVHLCIDSGVFFNWDYRRQADKVEAQTQYLMDLCDRLDRIEAVPEPEPDGVEFLAEPEPQINADDYRDDPLYSWLWEGNHGKNVTPQERANRIRSLQKMLTLVPARGFFREYLKTFTRVSDMNALYNVAGAYAVAGILTNRKVHKLMGVRRLICNNYFAIIGESTTGRKTQALTNAQQAISLVPQYRSARAPHLFSVQSLLESFGMTLVKSQKKGDPEPPTEEEMLQRIKIDMAICQRDPSVECTTGVRHFFCDEVTSFFKEIVKPANAGAEDMMMTFYDCPDDFAGAKYRTSNNVVVCRPSPFIFGCSTPSNISSSLSYDSLRSGFLPRWVFFPSWPEERDLVLSDPDNLGDEDYDDLKPHLENFRAARACFTPSAEANAFYDGWYRQRATIDEDELISWRVRLLTSAWKFAMLNQVDMGFDPDYPEISLEALTLAGKLTDELCDRLAKVWTSLCFTPDEKLSERVRNLVVKAGRDGVEHHKLMAKLKGKASAWKSYIDSAIEQRMIFMCPKKTATKTAQVYYDIRYLANFRR